MPFERNDPLEDLALGLHRDVRTPPRLRPRKQPGEPRQQDEVVRGAGATTPMIKETLDTSPSETPKIAAREVPDWADDDCSRPS
jgi:hypothetical protein